MKNLRLAILLHDIKGKFTHWKKGQQVKVFYIRGSSYCIERVHWRGLHALTNQCAGVPRSALQFL